MYYIFLKGFIELNVAVIMSYILFYIILLCHPRITSLYCRLLSRIMADRYRRQYSRSNLVENVY